MCHERISIESLRRCGGSAERRRPSSATAFRCAALFTLLVAATLAGCAPRYKIVLSNGNVFTSRGKPKLDPEQGVYRFKDALGNTNYVPSFRVKEIEPL